MLTCDRRRKMGFVWKCSLSMTTLFSPNRTWKGKMPLDLVLDCCLFVGWFLGNLTYILIRLPNDELGNQWLKHIRKATPGNFTISLSYCDMKILNRRNPCFWTSRACWLERRARRALKKLAHPVPSWRRLLKVTKHSCQVLHLQLKSRPWSLHLSVLSLSVF